jgi:chemotaxis protein MotB
MPRRKEEAPSVPEWVVTYGDLMSLLLCFFILLAAFSELKQEREYLDVVNSIQQAFGYESGVGRAPTDDIPTNTIVENIQEQLELKNKTESSDRYSPNIQDQSTKSTYLTQGIKFTLGGALTFQPGSAELSDQAKATLRDVAERIRGTRNKVEVRGHAHGFEDSRNGDDLYDLSYKRAKAAVDFLINQCNVSSQILVPVPVADQEPAQVDPLGSPNGAENRRVQIIQTEISIDEVNPDAYGTGRTPPPVDDN